MNDWYYGDYRRHDRIAVPILWVAIALSLLVHGVALWEWFPRMHLLAPDPHASPTPGAPLAVQIAPPPAAPPPPPPVAATPVPEPPRVAEPRRPPRPRPPVIARLPAPRPPMTTPQPAPVIVPPPPPAAAPAPEPPPVPVPSTKPPPAPTPIEGDLSAYIAARRRARGEAAPEPSPEEAEKVRRDRIVASNLASLNVTAAGKEMRNAGGMFTLRNVTPDEAEFLFFGWSNEAKRRQAQSIAVKRGDAPDIQIAVVRRMIAIIRDDVDGDFTFRSARLGRDVQLSARLADNTELEQFMLREFFDAVGRTR